MTLFYDEDSEMRYFSCPQKGPPNCSTLGELAILYTIWPVPPELSNLVALFGDRKNISSLNPHHRRVSLFNEQINVRKKVIKRKMFHELRRIRECLQLEK